jgi:hypothetical protein
MAGRIRSRSMQDPLFGGVAIVGTIMPAARAGKTDNGRAFQIRASGGRPMNTTSPDAPGRLPLSSFSMDGTSS